MVPLFQEQETRACGVRDTFGGHLLQRRLKRGESGLCLLLASNLASTVRTGDLAAWSRKRPKLALA